MLRLAAHRVKECFFRRHFSAIASDELVSVHGKTMREKRMHATTASKEAAVTTAHRCSPLVGWACPPKRRVTGGFELTPNAWRASRQTARNTPIGEEH